VLWICLSTAAGFLLEGKCLLGPPCECVYNTIACSRRNLTSIPAFTAAADHYNTIAVTFNFNQLTHVPARSFSSLGTTGAASIEIKLAWNQIRDVDQDAFEGIEHAVTYIDLSDNMLTSVPAVLGKLSAIKTLKIEGNPLTSLPATAMMAMGDTLSTLNIGLGLFNTWPSQMNLLTMLRSLTVSGLSSNDIPTDAFFNLNTTLQSLTLQGTRLSNIPSALCFLQEVKTFIFSSNYYIDKDNAGDPCQKHNTIPRAVTALTLSDDDLEGIPDIFSVFPAVTRLSLSDNNISFIYDDSSYDGNHVTEVDLKNNSFVTVPHVLNRFKELTVLRLDYNSITAIGPADLSGVTSLRLLYLTNNPITSIDPTAFTNNGQVTILDLSNTRLASVPVAVTSLPRLAIFHLNGVPVECSCTNMASLKTWNVTSARFQIGTCAKSGVSITSYIKHDLPKC